MASTTLTRPPPGGANQPENTATLYVRLGSRLSLSASRSGEHVTFRVTATRYNDNLDGFYDKGGWVRWDNRTVSIHFKSGSTWKTVTTLSSGKTGNASKTVTYAATRQWRAVDSGTSIIWNATSGTVRK